MKIILSEILTYLLFLQTLLFQVDMQELVLCFGDDGHIAIEKSTAYDCTLGNDSFNVNNTNIPLYNDNHNNCSDLVLDLHFSNANIQKNKKSFPDNIVFLHRPVYSKVTNDFATIQRQYLFTGTRQQKDTIRNTILLI